MPSALIFDFDGLIVDTETAIYQAWHELYASQGADLPLLTYVRCVGSTFHTYDPMEELEKLLDRKVDWPPLLEQKDARIRELHEGATVLPGVAELLIEAEGCGIPCVVASSSSSHWVEGWLERLNLRGRFASVRTRDHVARAKPAPDLFQAALDVLGAAPGEAVVLEDSANGLIAATAAGVRCVIVPNAITQHSDFTAAAAVWPTLEGRGLLDFSALMQ